MNCLRHFFGYVRILNSQVVDSVLKNVGNKTYACITIYMAHRSNFFNFKYEI